MDPFRHSAAGREAQVRQREAVMNGQFGEIFRPEHFGRTDHPVCAQQGGFASILLTAHPPLLFKEGNMLARRFIHTFLKD